ncbi:hypothetical protein VRY54_10095 [Actinomyces sp. F1_1611]
MGKILSKLVVFLGSSALGLFIAQWLLDGFRFTLWGFILAIVVFAVAQAVLSPLIEKVVDRYASVLVGGVGLISVFVSLLVGTFVVSGMTIRGAGTWVLATLIVWLVTAVATAALPKLFSSDRAA